MLVLILLFGGKGCRGTLGVTHSEGDYLTVVGGLGPKDGSKPYV